MLMRREKDHSSSNSVV